MLDPDQRALYTDALRPPPGFRFQEAVATTYSLDLQTLLTMPLHLALFSAEGSAEELLEDGVALLEALRRTTDHITVYAQSARVLAPRQPQVLFGLLEPTVVEVTAPSDTGVFHPKLWMIRFRNPDAGSERVRLLVLSRNITEDRSWDLALTLEGTPGAEPREPNEPLARLLAHLPGMAVRPVPPSRADRTRALAELAHRTEWELPEGFGRLRFHAMGLDGRTPWRPEPGRSLAVISPFLSEAALERLLDDTREPLALISRTEELSGIRPEVLGRFQRVLVLAEEAEREDGEEPPPPRDRVEPGHGLHAKAYLREWDRRTYVYVGSANATNPALVHGINVELVAELAGARSRVGTVEDLLDPDGMGAVLMEYLRQDDAEEEDPAEAAAEAALEEARRKLAGAGLALSFQDRGDGTWAMALETGRALQLDGVSEIRAWLVTLRERTAVDATPLLRGEPVAIPAAAVAHLTSFVVFELTAAQADDSVRFVLGLEAPGLPVDARDAAIVRDVIRNKDGFLRYVLLLLAEAGGDGAVFGRGGASWLRRPHGTSGDDLVPLFEHLTRAFCRAPERLESVDRLLAEMDADGLGDAGEDVVPPDFLDLWEIFRNARGIAVEEESP
jgi:hypothetical protein